MVHLNAVLYRKNTWIEKKEKLDAILIFKTSNANFHLFGELERGCLAWLPRVVTSRGYHE